MPTPVQLAAMAEVAVIRKDPGARYFVPSTAYEQPNGLLYWAVLVGFDGAHGVHRNGQVTYTHTVPLSELIECADAGLYYEVAEPPEVPKA